MNLSRQKNRSSLKSSVPYFSERLTNGEAVFGGIFTLQCKVDGYPKPEIHWEKNGKAIARSRNLQTSRNGERCILELKNVREMDLGVYQCIAVNINGKAVARCAITSPNMPRPKTNAPIPTSNLKVPKSTGIRSRSAERENHRTVWRSSSLSERLKDVGNRHKNLTETTRRSARAPLATNNNVLQKLNPNKLYHEEIQLGKISGARDISNPKPVNGRLVTEIDSTKTSHSKVLCSKSKFPAAQNRDNLQPNAKRTRNDLNKQQPVKCLKPTAQQLLHQVPTKSHKLPLHESLAENAGLGDIKVIVDDAFKGVQLELVHSPTQLPQDIDVTSRADICDISISEDVNDENLRKDYNVMRTSNDGVEGSCILPTSTETKPDCTTEVISDDRLQLHATPSVVCENEVLTEVLKLEDKRLPVITIDTTKDEDDDEVLPFDTCTCNCHQKQQHADVLRQPVNGSLRYSPDESECSPEELPPGGQLIYSLMESSPRRGSSPLTICTKGPAKILRGPVSLTVRNGEKVSLCTNFFGSPPNRITWTKAGTVIADGGAYSILNGEFESELVIHSVTVDDSGKYVFSVENDFGGDSCFASVAVLGFPKPPGGPPTPSDFTDHSLVLSWYGSMFDGGSVLTGYIVEMCQVPGRQWQTATTCVDTSCVVDGLCLGERYVFRIRARNRYGQSEPSGETQTICLEDYQTQNEETDENDELPNNVITIEKFADFMDRYDLKEEVGRGKFGKVHRCVDKWTGLPRAAKMIRCRKSKDRTDVHREIEVMKRLRHPKLLRIAGAFESDKMMVMVTEYISGGELFQRVIMDDFILTESDCILFMRQICDAVNYMHKCSVLHLDLKPENILCKTRTSHQIKIIDFGLSTFYNPKETLCILFGTPEFVAPEVIAFEPVGPASDMWSLGVICYVLLSGFSPFLGESERETFANITRGTIDFEEEEFDSISADAKNFISDIIIKNPRRRMTAAEALNHTWLKRAYWLEDYPPLSTEKLKKFIVRRKWQKSGTAIRALRRFVTLSRSSAESLGELMTPTTPISPAPTDSSEDSGIFHDSGCFDFSNGNNEFA